MTQFRVIDLKQFQYCPRLIYFHHCLPHIRPVTKKMERGIEIQQAALRNEARRSLKPYEVSHGERLYNVPLESTELGLRGKIELVIKTTDNPQRTPELIPVDFKNSRRGKPDKHLKLQLTAYALMLEENEHLPVKRGFLYYIPLRQAVEVRISARLKADLRKSVETMRKIVAAEWMPPPTAQRAKCIDCEFRRFCNDI